MVSLTALGKATFEQLRPMLRQHHLNLLAAFTPDQIHSPDEMLAITLRQAEHIGKTYLDLPKANRRGGANPK